MERLSLHPFCSVLNGKMERLWNIKLNSSGKLFLEGDGLVHLDSCQLRKPPLSSPLSAWFCKLAVGSLYLPKAQHTLQKPPVAGTLLGGLAVAVSTWVPSEAAPCRVAVTILVESQPYEAQFSKRKKGWLTFLTEWRHAKR